MTLKIKIIFLSLIGIILLTGIIIRPEFISFNLKRATMTDTLTFRLWAWQSGLKCWWENPFSGIGLGNYVICYQKYFQPKFQVYNDSVTWYDKSHNFYVDLLNETGLIGFSAFLLFLFAIGKTIWQMPKAYKLVLFPCLISYLISLGFFFPSFVDFSLFVILIAFINNFQIYEERNN